MKGPRDDVMTRNVRDSLVGRVFFAIWSDNLLHLLHDVHVDGNVDPADNGGVEVLV